MNCKAFEGLIDDFIENKLDKKELKEFIIHMDECESCRKDFEYDFYAIRGLKILNSDNVDAYDIREDMENTIAMARKEIRNKKYVLIFTVVGLTICVAALISLVLYYYAVIL